MLHKDVLPSDVHIPVSWIVADETARLAIVPGASDETKILYQEDTKKFYFLSDYTGPTWELMNPDYPTPFSGNAEDVSIADAGAYFTGTDVEAALQEIGQELSDQAGDIAQISVDAQTYTDVAVSNIITITFASADASEIADPADIGKMYEFTGTGAKELEFDVADTWVKDNVVHVSNWAASGNVTLVGTGITLSPPKGGTLVLQPGDTASVLFRSASAARVFGSTGAA